MKAVFMGTSGFAAYCLSRIAESRAVDIAAAYCKPEETRHRHKKDLPVHTEASRHGIPVGFPPTLKTAAALDELKKINPDLILVIDYGLILPRAVLDVPGLGCLNLHASLLPLYRGAAPIQRAVMNGEKKTGVTVMFMSEEVDAGDIVLQKDVDISDNDDFFSLSEKLEKEGAALMVRTLQAFSRGEPMERIPQAHQKATHAPKIKKEEGVDQLEGYGRSHPQQGKGACQMAGRVVPDEALREGAHSENTRYGAQRRSRRGACSGSGC